jgi:hypothetical protein
VRRFRDLGWGAAALVLALGLAWLAVVRSAEPLALDQGLFACFARFVPRGLLPYRDLFDSKPPLFLYLHVLAGRFGSDPAAALWRFETLWLAATGAVAFGLGRRWGRWAAVAAFGLSWLALWSPSWGGYWSRAQAEELLALPAIGAVWAALSARQDARQALVAGALVGVVGLIKVPGMAVGAACIAAWLEGGLWRRVAWMALGFAAPWALAFVWFGLHHGAGPFWEAVFVYQRHWAAFIAPPWSSVLAQFGGMMAAHAPGLLLLAAAGVGFSWRRDRGEALCLAVWIVAAAVAIVLQRQLAEYHYLLLMPPLAIAAARGLAGLAEALRSPRQILQIAGGVGLLAAGLFGLREAAALAAGYRADASYRAGTLSRAAYLRSFERGPFSPATEEEAARRLRGETQPGDSILVWGLSPGIYALADRMPATRYPFHQLLLTEAPFSLRYGSLSARRDDFLAALERHPPAVILVGTNDANGFEPTDSTTELEQFPPLRERVEREYRADSPIGAFLVYRRL